MFKTLASGVGFALSVAAMAAAFTVVYQTNSGTFVSFATAQHNSFVAMISALVFVGLLCFGMRRAAKVGVCLLMLAFATLSFGTIGANAQDVASVDGSKVTFSYGSFIMQYGLELAGWAVTALSTVASAAIAIYAPWAKSVATQQRLEMAGKAILQYAINAVPNSVKDGKVTVNVGSTVVATAVERGLDVLPAKVIKAAEGGGGLAAIVFRLMDLEEGASKATVLDPAVAKLQADGLIK